MPKKQNLQERLARSIRAERTKQGWTQEQVAGDAGLHLRHYQKLEEGSVNATLRTLERLSEALAVDVKKLFG